MHVIDILVPRRLTRATRDPEHDDSGDRFFASFRLLGPDGGPR